MTSIGIPYAFADFNDDDTPVRVCPECGERCPERVDDLTGEQLSNNYADHYAKAHAA